MVDNLKVTVEATLIDELSKTARAMSKHMAGLSKALDKTGKGIDKKTAPALKKVAKEGNKASDAIETMGKESAVSGKEISRFALEVVGLHEAVEVVKKGFGLLKSGVELAVGAINAFAEANGPARVATANLKEAIDDVEISFGRALAGGEEYTGFLGEMEAQTERLTASIDKNAGRIRSIAITIVDGLKTILTGFTYWIQYMSYVTVGLIGFILGAAIKGIGSAIEGVGKALKTSLITKKIGEAFEAAGAAVGGFGATIYDFQGDLHDFMKDLRIVMADMAEAFAGEGRTPEGLLNEFNARQQELLEQLEAAHDAQKKLDAEAEKLRKKREAEAKKRAADRKRRLADEARLAKASKPPKEGRADWEGVGTLETLGAMGTPWVTLGTFIDKGTAALRAFVFEIIVAKKETSQFELFAQSLSATIRDQLTGSIMDLSMALIDGTQNLAGLGDAITSGMADIFISVGRQMAEFAIKTGGIFAALGEGFAALAVANPVALIAIGAGLMVLGSVMKRFIGKGGGGGRKARAGGDSQAVAMLSDLARRLFEGDSREGRVTILQVGGQEFRGYMRSELRSNLYRGEVAGFA